MKKQIISLVIFMCLSLNYLSAQTLDTSQWSPPGATWVYSVTAMGEQKYYKLEYLKDTTVLSMVVKQMRASYIIFVGPGPGFDSLYRQPEVFIDNQYLYLSGDTVYWLNNGQFVFLYDFNAIIGHKWTITGDTSLYHCSGHTTPATDTISIVGLDSMVIGSHKFKKLSLGASPYWSLGYTILKNIGAYNTPFPLPKCNTIDGNINFPEALVCYHDSVRGWIDFGGSGMCYGIATAIAQTNLELIPSYILYPNPTTGHIYIKTEANDVYQVCIYNIMGSLAYTGSNSIDGIDISAYQSGIYICRITDKSRGESIIKLIKM